MKVLKFERLPKFVLNLPTPARYPEFMALAHLDQISTGEPYSGSTVKINQYPRHPASLNLICM